MSNAFDIYKENQSIFNKMITDFGVPQISQNDLLNELMHKFAPSNAIASFSNQEQAKIHILEFLQSLNLKQQRKTSSTSQVNNTSGTNNRKNTDPKNKNEKILKIYQEFKENILKDIKDAKKLITQITPDLDKSANKIVRIISQDPELLSIYQNHQQKIVEQKLDVISETDTNSIAQLSIKIANDLLVDEQDEQKKQQLQQIAQQDPEKLASQIQEQLNHQQERLRTDMDYAIKHDLFAMLYSQSQNTALQEVLNTGKIQVIENKNSALGIDFVENKDELKSEEIAQENLRLVQKKQIENLNKFGKIDSDLFLLDFGSKNEQLNMVSYFAIKLQKNIKKLNDPDVKINDLLSAFDSKTSSNSLFQRITAEKLKHKENLRNIGG
ncbi:hypothetical protein LBMAG18_11250 [Alphaproteobacteria bacterium]|nr:hypothetical protein LBMAG18_11250 [Alphaproteobacteria bacterium]